MASEKKKHDGYPSEEQLDPALKNLLREKAGQGELPCALGFDISKTQGVPVETVGMYADVLKIRLTKCQMGLFGHTPEKKRVKPVWPADDDLKHAIEKAVVDGALTCRSAWRIASEQNCGKMDVSCACEAMKIKIRDCQLGAF